MEPILINTLSLHGKFLLFGLGAVDPGYRAPRLQVIILGKNRKKEEGSAEGLGSSAGRERKEGR